MMESQNRKRAPAWTEREVCDLIAVWGDESVLSELHSKRRNAQTFEKISKGMKDRGYNRDPQQCHMKLKELRQAYQKNRSKWPLGGRAPDMALLCDELHAILGGVATTTPPLCFDSINGLSCSRDAHFGDEEDEEEEEKVEDSAQQASGETESQELFLTLDLEPVPAEPTQGGLPDPQGSPSVARTHDRSSILGEDQHASSGCTAVSLIAPAPPIPSAVLLGRLTLRHNPRRTPRSSLALGQLKDRAAQGPGTITVLHSSEP
ncbi:hypothetical protein UY3_00944 [Chelonia mydas]|uniref:Myb/SANT-like DNA-binding domain-containing protein n=1 Tax=Chelonia mydas TaxID=8469 RepID=M7CAS4_CHEMY|nr:hypothetical protein UY3_00944 [Chelonia mydas]